MFADTLLQLERAHLVRLIAWGALSVLLGTLLLSLLLAGRRQSPLLQQFAIQLGAWGLVELAIAAVAWRGLALRDLAGAVHLDRLLWLNIGLDMGYAAVGATLAILGWRLGRRLGLVGAGLGVVVHGLGLAVLDLVFVAQVGRFV